MLAAVFACRLGAHETTGSFPPRPADRRGWREPCCRSARALPRAWSPRRRRPRARSIRRPFRPTWTTTSSRCAARRRRRWARCCISRPRARPRAAARSPARWSRSGNAMRTGSTIIRASPAASGAIRRSRATAACWPMPTAAISFRTLKPVAYPGRTPHIHLKVATASGGLLTSQFYIAGDPQQRARRRLSRRPRAIRVSASASRCGSSPAPGLESGRGRHDDGHRRRLIRDRSPDAPSPTRRSARRCRRAAGRWRDSRHRRNARCR